MMYDLIVIGGGPAGMLGAATAGANGLKVLLLEKNEKLGKKLYLTGKGRCNVTNNGDFDDFLSNIVTNPKFLYSALSTFDNRRLIGLLESLGVRIKVERGNRVFPLSDKSSDIIKALQHHLLANKVEIRLHATVKQILTRQNQVCGALADNTEWTVRKCFGHRWHVLHPNGVYRRRLSYGPTPGTHHYSSSAGFTLGNTRALGEDF